MSSATAWATSESLRCVGRSSVCGAKHWQPSGARGLHQCCPCLNCACGHPVAVPLCPSTRSRQLSLVLQLTYLPSPSCVMPQYWAA